MFKFKAFASETFGLLKRHPLLFLGSIGLVVIFAAAPFFAAYRFVRAKVPGADKVMPAK